ncbi:MAG: NTPase [Candidatus Lokiarchaeota archaeon]|nr:NTPase [Candidatus Lokiarchaeota archaeon]
MFEIMKKNIVITGRPGCGKSTLALKIKDLLEAHDYKVGGLITPEIKDGRRRKGFKIIDICKNKKGILARINQSDGPRVSKYKVNLEDLNNISTEAIRNAINECDLIIIDEIGKMELFSESFQDNVLHALNSKKIVLATMGGIKHQFVKKIKERKDIEIITLTRENRDQIFRELQSRILNHLKDRKNKN